MKRRLFNILSAISLLMLVLLGVLWVRGYWVTEEIGYRYQPLPTDVPNVGQPFLLRRRTVVGRPDPLMLCKV